MKQVRLAGKPMTLATDNRTLQLLRNFAQRRRRLILLRGVAATVIVLLGTMFAVALIDRLVLMETPARVAMSLAAYVAAVLVAWRTAGRNLVRADDPAELARMIESAEPVVRNRLLAAIELGQWANGAAAFRQIVREDANRRSAQVRVERTLPWRLISWWMAAGAGAIALCAILLSVPQLQFGRMLGRALLPTAPIARASRYAIEFTGGHAPRLIPAAEETDFEVLVTGGQPKRVWLEIEGRGQARRKVPMDLGQPVDGGLIYRAAIALEGPAVMRAWADDAESARLSVDVRPRPSVLSFTKSYTPPAYLLGHAQASPPATHDDGVLEALHGSTAVLELQADQPIRSGVIELLGSDGQALTGAKSIELVAAPGQEREQATRLATNIPIEFEGAYRVELVAAETGLETRHAPVWPVRAIADLPPTVQTEATQGRPISPDALLSLRAMVQDDVGLAWIRRDVRINGGDWVGGTLEERDDAARQVDWSAPFDLLPLALVPGDRVESRLVVSDLKGSESVGSFGEWIIVADGVEDSRLQTLMAKQELAAAAARLAAAAAALDDEARRAAARHDDVARTGGGDSIEADQLWLGLATRAGAVKAAADDAFAAALSAIERMNLGRDASDVERLGQSALAARLLAVQVASLAEQTTASEHRLAEVKQAGAAAAELATAGSTLAQTLVHTEQAALAARELRLTLNDADNQVNQARAIAAEAPEQQALFWQQVSRNAAATAARLQGARERLDEVRAAFASDRATMAQIDEIRAVCDRASERLRRALREESGPELLEPVARVHASLNTALSWLGEIAVALEQRLAFDRAQVGPPPSAAALDELADGVPGGVANWAVAIERLGDRARLHERRVELDRAFLSDLTLAQRAVRAMALAEEDMEDPAVLSRRAVEVAKAMHVLESGHALAALRLRMSSIHDAEKTEPDRWSLDRWRDWLSFKAELEPAAAQLVRTGHAREAVNTLVGLDEQRSGRAFEDALQQPEDVAARRRAVEASGQMLASLSAAQAAIEPAMQAARAVLGRDATPLSEWMAQLSDEAAAMSQRTRTAGDPAEAAREQAEFDGRLRELEEAIRRDAAQQDLLTESGRERARDADDAVAMLRDGRSQMNEEIAAARDAPEDQREEAANRAADAQKQASDTLAELAEHYRNLEAEPQKLADSRQALRAQENDLGIKQRLESEYQRMERLADMQKLSDPELLEALEQELKENEAMQRELGKLADDAARQGQQQLESAARQERSVQETLDDAQQAADRAERAAEGRGDRLAELARNLAQNDLPQLRQRLEQGPESARSPEELKSAQEAIEQGARAAEEQEFSEAAEALEQARNSLQKIEQRQRTQWELDAAKMYEAAQKANSARNAGAPDPQAEADRDAANQAAQAANRSRTSAQQTKNNAEQALEEAQRLAQQQERAQGQSQQALQEAAQQQEQIAGQANEAAQSLERASRHEERLGNAQKSEAMQQSAQASRQASQQQVPAAAQAARQAQNAGDARQPVEQAAQALESGAQQAQQASAMPDQAPAAAARDRAASMMAQALDRLDRAMKGQQGQTPSQNAQQGQQADSQSAAQAMAQRAADSQARGMRNRRLPAPPGNPANTQSAGADLAGMVEEELTVARPEGGGDWGRLPPEIVKDLVQGQRDVAPAEYRDLVEAYYRAIAQRAKDKQ